MVLLLQDYYFLKMERDIIDNDMLPDFLYSELKIRDIERVMVLIDGNDSYGAEFLKNGKCISVKSFGVA